MRLRSNLSIRQLRAFIEVYELRKLSAAAERLCVTPSAVSMLLRELEEAVGSRLFDRTTRTLTPTASAKAILPTVQRLLRDATALTSGMISGDELSAGIVRFAVTPALGQALLPTMIRNFHSAYPQVRLLIEDCPPQQFLGRILDDELDFGIGRADAVYADLAYEVLKEDQLNIVCRLDHPLASAQVIRWRDLVGHPVVIVRLGSRARRLIDAAAVQAGIELSVAGEVAYLPSALWMVASGLGAAILPSIMSGDLASMGLVSRTLEEPLVKRDICVVTRRRHSLAPNALAFLDMLRLAVAGGAEDRKPWNERPQPSADAHR